MSQANTAPEQAGTRAEAVRALEAEFGELITHVRRLITENANRVSPGLNPGAYKIFTTIARRGPVTLSALAECLQLDKGQLSRAVRELEKRGLVRRDPDPDDGRSALLTATDEGRERLAAARGARDSSTHAGLQDWDIADIHELTRLIRALVASAAGAAD